MNTTISKTKRWVVLLTIWTGLSVAALGGGQCGGSAYWVDVNDSNIAAVMCRCLPCGGLVLSIAGGIRIKSFHTLKK